MQPVITFSYYIYGNAVGAVNILYQPRDDVCLTLSTHMLDREVGQEKERERETHTHTLTASSIRSSIERERERERKREKEREREMCTIPSQ